MQSVLVHQTQLLFPSPIVAPSPPSGSSAAQPTIVRGATLSGVMMPQVFDWILPDRLGACVNPYVSQSAVIALQTNGITMLVNLHERPDPQDVLDQLQAQTIHLPVPDSNAPTQAQIDEGVAAIDKALQEGKRVAVHCGAGLGRSGTLIAAYLVSQGQAPEQAMAQVRTARPGSIETLEQEAAVHEYARRLNAS